MATALSGSYQDSQPVDNRLQNRREPLRKALFAAAASGRRVIFVPLALGKSPSQRLLCKKRSPALLVTVRASRSVGVMELPFQLLSR